MFPEGPEQGKDQQQGSEGDDPHVLPRRPNRPLWVVCGPAIGILLESAIDSARCLLFVLVDPPEIIGVQDIAFERFQHRPDLDPVGAADVKQTASGANGEIFIFEDVHYHGAAAPVGDVPRHPGLLHPPHRFFDPVRCTLRAKFGKWQGWDMPPLPARRRGRCVNLPRAAGISNLVVIPAKQAVRKLHVHPLRSFFPSFPRKRESRDFSLLPWTPAFAEVTITH
jgi:hypothetical protein